MAHTAHHTGFMHDLIGAAQRFFSSPGKTKPTLQSVAVPLPVILRCLTAADARRITQGTGPSHFTLHLGGKHIVVQDRQVHFKGYDRPNLIRDFERWARDERSPVRTAEPLKGWAMPGPAGRIQPHV
jgi:hypothetical protein